MIPRYQGKNPAPVDFLRQILSGTKDTNNCIFCLHALKVALFHVVQAVGITEFFNVESVKTYSMNSSKREKKS